MKRLSCGGVWVGLAGLVAAAAGCGGAQPAPAKSKAAASETKTAAAPHDASCERTKPGIGAVRHSTLRQGGSVVLAKHGATTLAYVADEDSKALHTVDVAKGVQIAKTKLAGAPAQALVL